MSRKYSVLKNQIVLLFFLAATTLTAAQTEVPSLASGSCGSRVLQFFKSKFTASKLQCLTRFEWEECDISAPVQEKLYAAFSDANSFDISAATRHTESRTATINVIKKGVADWAKNLGFDVSERLPANEKIYFFEEPAFRSVAQKANHGSDTYGFWTPFTWSLALTDDPAQPFRAYSALTHELVHLVSRFASSVKVISNSSLRISEHKGFMIASTVLENAKSVGEGESDFLFLHETTTEFTGQIVYGSLQKQVRKILSKEIGKKVTASEWVIGYPGLTMLYDRVISDIAQRTGQKFSAVLRLFQSSLLTGDRQGVETLLSRAYGNEGMNQLKNAGLQFEQTLQILQILKINIPEAIADSKRWNENKIQEFTSDGIVYK